MIVNGQIPYSVVSVVLGSGTDSNGYWEFRCTPAFAARWAFAKRYAEQHFGRTLHIRPGWNIYRPLFSQQIARTNACNQGNCKGAAWPGTSSHGGEWNGRICLAVDVDPNGLTWAQVDEAMEAAGFSAGLITAAMSGFPGGEPWHYILFGDLAFGAVPAGLDASPFDPQEEDDMYTDQDRALLIAVKAALLDGNAVTGMSTSRLDVITNSAQRIRGVGDEFAYGDQLQFIRSELAATRALLQAFADRDQNGTPVDVAALLRQSEDRQKAYMGETLQTFAAGLHADLTTAVTQIVESEEPVTVEALTAALASVFERAFTPQGEPTT